jgi:hypothetical protein
MPAAFTRFYMKPGMLDRKLKLSAATVVLVRQLVASTNLCLFCMDANRWSAINRSGVDQAKLDALGDFRASPLFSDHERAALGFAQELTRDRRVNPATFAELARHYSEQEICEIVFLVSSEHLYNINNLGLNIGSAGICSPRNSGRPASRPTCSWRTRAAGARGLVHALTVTYPRMYPLCAIAHGSHGRAHHHW